MNRNLEQKLPEQPGDEPLIGIDEATNTEYTVDRLTPAEAQAIATRPDEFYDGVVTRAVRKRGTRTTIPATSELDGVRYPTEVTLREESIVLRALSAFGLRRPTSVLRIQARYRNSGQAVEDKDFVRDSSDQAA